MLSFWKNKILVDVIGRSSAKEIELRGAEISTQGYESKPGL